MFPDEKEVIGALRKLKELAAELMDFSRERGELASVLGRKVRLGSLPPLRKEITVECGTYAGFATYDFLRLRVEKQKVRCQLTGYKLKIVDADDGAPLSIVSLEEPKIEDLIALAVMEKECKLLTRLIEEVRRVRGELAEHLEKVRKVAALVEMAMKS